MTKGFRITLATAALAGGLALAGVAPAQAQVRFRGSFPLPHGPVSRVSRVGVRFGDPFFRVGAVVPRGFTVIEDPAFGWGFYSGSRWIPVERYGSGWYVCERPWRGARAFVRPGVGFRGFRAFNRRSLDRDRGFAAPRFDRFERGGRGEHGSFRTDRRGRSSREGRHR